MQIQRKDNPATPSMARTKNSNKYTASSGPSLVNKRIAKFFDKQLYFGTITNYNTQQKFWCIHYDDGDYEEMEFKDLNACLKLYDKNMANDTNKVEEVVDDKKKEEVATMSTQIQEELIDRRDSTSIMKEGEDIRAPWLTPSKDDEDDGSNQWPKPYLAIQEQLVQGLTIDSSAATLLRELVDRIDQGSITDLDSGVLCTELDIFVNVLCTELKRVGNSVDLRLDDALNYWNSSRSKYQALFNHHPVVPYVIRDLFEVARRSLEDKDGKDFRLVAHAFVLLQCQVTSIHLMKKKYEEIEFSSDVSLHRSVEQIKEYLAWFPILGAWFGKKITIESALSAVMTVLEAPISIERQLGLVRGHCISISFVKSDMAEASVKEYTVTSSMLLKWLCRAYARDSNVPLKSMRLTCEGRSLFLSEGKKTVDEVGLKHLSVISVTVLDNQSATDTVKDHVFVSNKSNRSKSSKTKKKQGKKKRNGNKKKKPASNNCYSLMSEEEKHRQLHSKALSKVFEEAERTKFFSIRQRLNAMNLECMKPKSKKRSSKTVPPIPQSVDNPPTSGEGGKAGKSHVFVQVGEESNLYKTSKPLSNRSNQRSSSRISATNKAIVIDLHGLSKKAALAKLDKALPVWIDLAMQGGYPFVRTVKIVHGGGNQVLEEVVASWIRQNRQVANAPKSMCM